MSIFAHFRPNESALKWLKPVKTCSERMIITERGLRILNLNCVVNQKMIIFVDRDQK